MWTTDKKAVVAGHICLDITPLFPDKKISRPEEILSPGGLVHMEGVDVHTGGAVANTGLAMKLLGVDVKLMGKIGTDEFGKLILQVLEKYGYDAREDMIQSDQTGTSYSVVLAIPGIDRMFLHSIGANNTFCFDDLDFSAISEASLFHLGYPPLMKRLYEQDGEELVRIFKKVKELGVATSLDMAAVDPSSEEAKTDWKKILKRVLPYVDFFVPSIEELCFMMDKDRYWEWNGRSGGEDVTEYRDVESDIRPLADELFEMGAKVVMLKCGAPGLYYRSAGKEILAGIGEKAEINTEVWADKEGFERSYKPERVLSGTGAGDTSIAAFLTAMLQGKAPESCIQLAAATGASCVEGYDALSGLKPFEELQRKIDAGWEKQLIQKNK